MTETMKVLAVGWKLWSLLLVVVLTSAWLVQTDKLSSDAFAGIAGAIVTDSLRKKKNGADE